MKNKIKSTIFAIAFFSILTGQIFALPEYKTSYLKERVKACYITNNKILGSVKQFFPYIGYLVSPETSTVFFTEDRETGDFYSLSSKRLYQFDGTYLRYIGDQKDFLEKFNNKEKFYMDINAEFYSSSLSFEGKEKDINYYSAKITSNLVGGWKVILGLDSNNKIVSIKEEAEGFTFKPYSNYAIFKDCPEFVLFESTSKEVYKWVVDYYSDDSNVSVKQYYDNLTKNNWKDLYFKKETSDYLEKFTW